MARRLLLPGEKENQLSFLADAIHGQWSGPTITKEIRSIPIRRIDTRSYSNAPESFSSGTLSKETSSFILSYADRDLTVSDLKTALEGKFILESTSTQCPLTQEQQRNSCEFNRIPDDPSGGELSYEAVQIDRNGDEIAASKTKKTTRNIYRLLNAMTRPACPQWKIRSFSLHPQRNANEGTESLKMDTRGAVRHLVQGIRPRSAEILKNYASGGTILLESCISLRSDSPRSLDIKSLFEKIDPERIPLASIRVRKSVCTSLTSPPNSSSVPVWMETLVGPQSQEGAWVNPRFAIPLAPESPNINH